MPVGGMKQRTAATSSVGFPRTPRKRASRQRTTYEYSFAQGAHLGSDLVVTDQVSAGPFTEIYRVWSETRMCYFACKLLRPTLAAEGEHAKALDVERRVLGRLEHPNVVRSYPSEASVELPHVLMECLPGPSLVELLAASPKRRLKVDHALKVAIQVGSALEAVHGIGLVYRDLKPANIVMRERTPVLIDFGSVYRWKPGRAPRERVGTDPYMAPEQCLGEPLSPAADVFGLGAVTYEMLTGEWPYEDQLMNVFDRSRLHNRFPQIAHRPGSIRRRVAGVGPELEAVVHKCLERDPARRFATVAEAVVELNRFLERDDRIVPIGLLNGDRSDQAA